MSCLPAIVIEPLSARSADEKRDGFASETAAAREFRAPDSLERFPTKDYPTARGQSLQSDGALRDQTIDELKTARI
jgi:hypothetical protein